LASGGGRDCCVEIICIEIATTTSDVGISLHSDAWMAFQTVVVVGVNNVFNAAVVTNMV
jgi:hypothetical protein